MKKERIFWGIFFILGAIFILVAKLGFFHNIGIWSLIWTIFCVAILIKGIVRLNFFFLFMPIAFLGITYAEQLQIQAVTPWPILGAAILLSIGCSMIFPSKRGKRLYKKYCNQDNFTVNGEDRIINEEDGASCSCSVHFGSSIKYINSEAFETGSFEVSFGALKVYFDNAIMKGTQAYAYVDNHFGGTELFVPKAWTVVNRMDNVFAGVDEKGRNNPDGVHTLYIQGDNHFGGVTIYYI